MVPAAFPLIDSRTEVEKKNPKIQRLIDLDKNHDYSHWRCDNEEDVSLSA